MATRKQKSVILQKAQQADQDIAAAKSESILGDVADGSFFDMFDHNLKTAMRHANLSAVKKLNVLISVGRFFIDLKKAQAQIQAASGDNSFSVTVEDVGERNRQHLAMKTLETVQDAATGSVDQTAAIDVETPHVS